MKELIDYSSHGSSTKYFGEMKAQANLAIDLQAELDAAKARIAELLTSIKTIKQTIAETPHGRSRVETVVIRACDKVIDKTPAQWIISGKNTRP